MNPDVEDAPAEGESAIERDLRGGAGLAVAPAPESPLPEVLWYGIVTENDGDYIVAEFLGIGQNAVHKAAENRWGDIPSEQDCSSCDGRGTWQEDCHDCGHSVEHHCCDCCGSGKYLTNEHYNVEAITLADAKERWPLLMADANTVLRLTHGQVIVIEG